MLCKPSSRRHPLAWLATWITFCVALTFVDLRPSTAQQLSSQTFVADELLVKFRPTARSGDRTAAFASAGAVLLRRFEQLGIDHVRLPRNLSVQAALRILAANPHVLLAQPNYLRHITADPPPNDPFWLDGSMWGLMKIGAQAAWTHFSTGSSNIVVAVIDTGVDYNHPDLIANVWTNPGEIPGNGIDDDGNGYIDDVHGIDTFNNDADPMDDNGHGTHTAGTIGAAGNNGIGVVGVNWNVKLLACKFLDSTGSGSDAGAIACFNYLVTEKQRGVNIRVSSNSWGSAREGGVDRVLKDAIDAAGNAGILNVFAAGNSGANNDVTPFDPASYTSPSIVSVAASDINDDRASFSNYGASSVDLAAPGVAILSTYLGNYGGASGTSMATPHVAGAAALLLARQPTLTVAALKTALLNSVDILPQWNGLVASGGRLNVHASLQSLGGPTVTLTDPSDGATFTGPATVALRATATGTISVVDFYNGTSLLYSDVTAPYGYDWIDVPAGAYRLTAVAMDNMGIVATSNEVNVTVSNAGPPSQTLLTTQVPGRARGLHQGHLGARAARGE